MSTPRSHSRAASKPQPQIAGFASADELAFAKTAFEGMRPRELGLLTNRLALWLLARVKSQPSPPFIAALTAGPAPKVFLNDNNSIDGLIRTMLGITLTGPTPKVPVVAPAPAAPPMVVPINPADVKAVPPAGVAPGTFIGIGQIREDNESKRMAQYAKQLNILYGSGGVFEMTPNDPAPFSAASVKTMINTNPCVLPGAAATTILFPAPKPMTGIPIGFGGDVNAPLLMMRTGGGRRAGRSQQPQHQKAPPRPAGADPVVTSEMMTQYVPTIPRVSQIQRVTTPCMFERKVQTGPGYWAWRCERTTQSGVKKCSLMRVEDKRQTLVPMSCLQEYVNVLNGYQVNNTTSTDALGNTVVRQTVTPEVSTYGTVRRGPQVGPPIPYENLPKYSDQIDPQTGQVIYNPANIPTDLQPTPLLLSPVGDIGRGHDLGGGRAAGRLNPKPVAGAAMPPRPHAHPHLGSRRPEAKQQLQSQRTAGATLASQGPARGGAVRGGAIALPRRSDVREAQFTLTNADVQDITTGVPPDMIVKPASWSNLQPPLDGISFYTYDGTYGTAPTRNLANGFDFSFKYRPYAYMTNQAYLEWLVSLDYKMRAEFPEDHHHVYDPLLDTIATVETYILATLGRLEAKGQYFDRRALFAGAAPFQGVMQRFLRFYALRPPTATWYSPLSGRYTAVPTGASMGTPQFNPNAVAPAEEVVTLTALKNLYASVVNTAQSGQRDSGVPGGFKIPLKFRNPANFHPDDQNIVGVWEDELLSLLARLQYMYGFAINMQPGLQPEAATLLLVPQRRFLSRELVDYLEMFSMTDNPNTLHRLPGLRMAEAAEQGIAVPNTAMGAYGRDWQAATMAELPVSVVGTEPPAAYITTMGRPRRRRI